MDLPCPAPSLAAAQRALEAALGPPAARSGAARVVFPRRLESAARTLAAALALHARPVDLVLTDDVDFSGPDHEASARAWVPAPGPGVPPLLLLYGAQPWGRPFEDDYRVELAAMGNREALKAAGHALVFVEWPRGARRDAEVDLRPGPVASIFERALDVDYEELRAWNQTLIEALTGVDAVAIRCPAGTDLRLRIGGRRRIAEDCRLGELEPAVFLPGGEVYVAVREDSAAGVVAFRSRGEPRLARFEGGLLVAVETGDGRADVGLAEEMAVGREPLCEFGVGTNCWAPPWQIGTIYEKSAGTVHVAVGGNAHFGGRRRSPRHVDLVIRDPAVRVDGRPLALPRADWKRLVAGADPESAVRSP